jgi:RNA polymerase sigma-70 factor (ECF subfamily)
LLNRHAWLRRVALARGGEPAAVDDIMQDVAVAAANGYASLRDGARIDAWLYRLTVTAALQYRRRMGRQRRLAMRFAEQTQPTDIAGCDPLDWIASSEQSATIRQALQRLPPKDVEILLLKYGDDLSYAELAARLGLSTSAVDGRLQRARTRLRSQLARQAPAMFTRD